MMSLTWGAALVCVAVGLDITLAPDQPLAQAYVGEPVVIEFISSTDQFFSGRVSFEINGVEEESHPIGPLALRAGMPYWHPLSSAGNGRGAYDVSIYSRTDLLWSGRFCRIDRPAVNTGNDVVLHWENFGKREARIVRALGQRQVRLEGMSPGLDQRLAHAREAGLDVYVALDIEQGQLGQSDGVRLGRDHGHQVARWEIDTQGSASRYLAWARDLREANPGPLLAPVVRSPREISTLLRGAAGPFIDAFVVRVDQQRTIDLAAFRIAAENEGYEGLPLDIACFAQKWKGSIASFVLANRAKGFSQTVLSGSMVFEELGPGRAYTELSGMAHWLGESAYVGPLLAATGQRGHFFRRTGEHVPNGSWIAYFGEIEKPNDIAIGLGAGTHIELVDSFNNSRGSLEPEDGVVVLRSGRGPLILRGEGGIAEADAAWARVAAEAENFLSDERIADIPPETRKAVEELLENGGASSARYIFFTIVRALPTIEEGWRDGELSKQTAPATIGGLARLARALATHEQATGEPFLEPLRATLALCADLQSLYVTGKSGGPYDNPRGDRLLAETQRLIAEAEALASQRRPIEANAVAALAEWRARSLLLETQPRPFNTRAARLRP